MTQKGFQTCTIKGIKLLTFDSQIVIPRLLQTCILAWYHHYLRHPWVTRMEATLKIAFWWEGLARDVAYTVKTCPSCQKFKKVRKKYGKLPPKEAEEAIPWKQVNVNLIGPLRVTMPSGEYVLNALTMIDPAMGWFEVAEVSEHKAKTVAKVFDDTWLSHYPRPKEIGFDNGGKNKGMLHK